MVNLTPTDLENLNRQMQELYNTTAGILKPGLLRSLAATPEQTYKGEYRYPDVFTKAASLFEGLCRLHVFSDLNKRTALIATRTYMRINGYVFLVPISAVRFSVKVADDQNTDDDYTQKLIRRIAKWISKYSAKRGDLQEMKTAVKNSKREPDIITTLFRLKLDPLAHFLINRWLAVHIYPEYKRSRSEVLSFLFQMLEQSRVEFDEDFPE